MEQCGVFLGREHRKRSRVSVHRLSKWLLVCNVGSEGVRDVIEIGGHLDRQLAARREHRAQSRKQGWMIADPLHRRVGEDDVEWRIRLPVTDVTADEAQPVGLEGSGTFEHCVRRIDTERFRRPQLAMQAGGEQPGSASEIDNATASPFGDQCHEVVEGLLTLRAKTFVLARTPGVAHGHAAGGATEAGVVNIGRQDSVARCDPECGPAGHSERWRLMRGHSVSRGRFAASGSGSSSPWWDARSPWSRCRSRCTR